MEATRTAWQRWKPCEPDRNWQNWILILPLVLLTGGCEKTPFVSSNMTPTIRPGEVITIDYSAYALAAPKRWDVVAFEAPGETNQIWLMRVVGMPGEKVSFATNGVTVNEQPLLQPSRMSNIHYSPLQHVGVVTAYPYVVPNDSYFVLGDNTSNAKDSRYWGALPRTNIIGRVKGK